MHLGRAAVVGMIGSLCAGLSLFIVFRVSIEVVGAATLGNWIMIQSLFIFARLPEAGIGVSLTRLVALDGRASARPYILAGIILNVLPIALVGAAIAYPIVRLMSGHFQSQLPIQVLELLVGLSFCYAVVIAFATIILSVLEGLGGITARNWTTIASNAVLASSVYPLTARFGVVGTALAYLLSAFVLLAAAQMLLYRRQTTSILGDATVRDIMSRLWRQSVTLSLTAIVRLGFEPWTKFMVGTLGGLALASYFDFALRVTTQIRVAVQAGTQPLLAFGAREEGAGIDRTRESFQSAQALVVKANVFLLGVQVTGTALVASFGFGYIPAAFAPIFVLLTAGSSLNSLGVVGYYHDVTEAKLGRIFRVQLGMLVITILTGCLFALAWGAIGFVLGYALAFAFGGFALARSWLNASGEGWLELLKPEATQIAASFLAAFAAVWSLRTSDPRTATIVSLGIVSALTLLFVIRNWHLLRYLRSAR